MSLIQEALKRQQQEVAEQHKPEDKPKQPDQQNQPAQSCESVQPVLPQAAPVPPVPPPAPEQIKRPNLDLPIKSTENKTATTPKKPMSLAHHEPAATPVHAIKPENLDSKKKSGGSPWRKLIIALIILFIIIAGATVMIFFAMKKLEEDQLEKVVPRDNEEVEDIIYAEPETVEHKPDTAETEPEEVSLLQKIIKKKPEPTINTQSTHPSVKWPQLKVTAALAKGGIGQAIINGKFVTVGEKIDGVKLVKISGNTVEFSYKNEKKFLKVGNSSQ